MSIDIIGSFYTNGVEARSVRTVICTSGTAFQGDSSSGTAAYSGLFGAGSLITNITCAPSGALGGDCTISAQGMCASLLPSTAPYIVQFAGSSFNTVNGFGNQSGLTLPQDSWLQASGTGVVPTLFVSYLS